MTRCIVTGHATATIAHPSLQGFRLALCQRIDSSGKPDGSPPVIAVDTMGAAIHQEVIMSTDGSSAQALCGDPSSPIRNSILGIIDPEPATTAD